LGGRGGMREISRNGGPEAGRGPGGTGRGDLGGRKNIENVEWSFKYII